MNIKTSILFSLFFCLLALTTAAQSSVIEGTITDARSGEPLIGASVKVSSSMGTITDLNGFYTLRIPHGDYTVSISYIGYKTIKKDVSLLPPGESIILDFALETASEVLNTVTVTSGKYEKPIGEVTVSLEVLQPSLIESTNKVTLDQAIEKIPGVQVIDGQANIRGGSGYSFGAGSRVLLLQDDIPILQQDVGFPNWFDVPIENVSQIEVVKGAASALYGSAALNGIINFRTAFAKEKPETKASIFYTHFMNPPEESLKWWDGSAPYAGGLSLTHKQKFDKLDLVAGGAYQNQQAHLRGSYRKFGRFNVNTRYRFTDRLSAGLNANFTTGTNNIFFYWRERSRAYEEFPGTASRSDFTRYNIDPYLTYFDPSGNRHKLLGRFYSVDNDVSNGRKNTSSTIYTEYQFQRQLKEWGLVATAGLVFTHTKGTAELYGDTTLFFPQSGGLCPVG
jgi:outer membrane receptor protein involved in Fe transport